MKNWIVWYKGYLGNTLFSYKMTKKRARKIFKECVDSFAIEKVSGWFKHIKFKKSD